MGQGIWRWTNWVAHEKRSESSSVRYTANEYKVWTVTYERIENDINSDLWRTKSQNVIWCFRQIRWRVRRNGRKLSWVRWVYQSSLRHVRISFHMWFESCWDEQGRHCGDSTQVQNGKKFEKRGVADWRGSFADVYVKRISDGMKLACKRVYVRPPTNVWRIWMRLKSWEEWIILYRALFGLLLDYKWVFW